MPKLARMRLVSVGHPRARFDDLLLDFRDPEGLATDTVLWLRNGGGKSSLLNLFYSVVRPRQTDFLGGKGGEERRRLGHYVLHDDRAVVACEWQLDGGGSLFEDEPVRYLTVVLSEHRDASPVDGPDVGLNRLFLAAESRGDVPELTLEGLPLTTATDDGHPMGFSLAALRRVWRDLQAGNPHCGVFLTERQSDWLRELEGRGIDTRLFGYQLQMNAREGGVSQLFSFRDADSFADFLLETAFDDQDAERVREQVSTFRKELLRRHTELQPDRELCQGLLERLAPFEDIGRSRAELRAELAALAGMSHALAENLASLHAGSTRAKQKCEEAARRYSGISEQQHALGERLRRRTYQLHHYALTSRLDAAALEQRERRAEMEEAAHQEDVWTAAVPLSRAMSFETEAREYREQVRALQAEHAPLIQRLRKAASALHALLSEEVRRVEDQAQECRADSEAKRAQARGLRRRATDVGRQAAAAAAQAQAIASRLAEAETRWRRLVDDGIALDTDTPSASGVVVARLGEEISALEAALGEVDEAIVQAEGRRDSLAKEQAQASQAVLGCEVALEGVRGELAAMRTARDALASDQTLRRLLQVESPEVDKVCREAIWLAQRERERASESILELRLTRADDEWATGYLRDHGRLPPAQDVLTVLGELQKRGVTCWSGWQYLESNVAREQQRQTIARQPHLVNGVIVPDEAVLESLRETVPAERLAWTVAIGTPAHLLEDATGSGYVVWGPSDDGLFDSAAAGRADAGMTGRIEKSRSAESELKGWRDSLERLLGQLTAYEHDYPAGWTDEARGRHEQLSEDVAAEKERFAALTEQLDSVRAESQKLAARRREQHDRQIALTTALRRAADFDEQFGRHVEQWKRDQDDLHRTAQARDGQSEECEHKADLAEADAVACDDRAHQLGANSSVLRHERDGVCHAQAGRPMPAGLSLDAARKDYELLLGEYESKIGADNLEALAARCDRNAAEARRRFEVVRKPDVSEEEAAEAVRSLAQNRAADEARDEAKESHWRAKQALGEVGARIKQFETRLEDLVPPPRSESITEDEVPSGLSADDAEAEAERSARLALEADKEAGAAEAEARRWKEKGHTVSTGLVRIEGMRERVRDTCASHAALLAEVGDAQAPEAEPLSVEECAEALDRLATGLGEGGRRWNAIGEEAERTTRAIHDWCRQERFAALPGGISDRFARFTAAEVEAGFEYYREHLRTRVEQIDADLEEANKQREIVVDAVMSSVDQALRLLRRVATLSRLPDTVPGGGRRFLQITTSEPDKPAERRARVAELVDQVIQSGALESGMQLVQRATRRVAGPLRVGVLHPDHENGGRRVPIQQMANFSGGERLTGAILLYCALARLRGQELGTTGKRTSALLLDNPIGTVSRVRYLDLQREVARALGIQLIYATGVNDIDAVASLPNVIRLRNFRRDVRSGRRVVEFDEDAGPAAESVVEAVRVHTVSPVEEDGQDQPEETHG